MPKRTVLVVEDDTAVVAFVTAALEEEGYRAVSAADGPALTTAQREQPDVILMDIHMPGMDGRDVSARLRADPRTAHIPIILMAAHVRRLGPQMPAEDEPAKPFGLDHLYSTVAMRRWRAGSGGGEPGGARSCSRDRRRTAVSGSPRCPERLLYPLSPRATGRSARGRGLSASLPSARR